MPHDLREESATKGETDVYYMGEDNPMLLLIPKGVAHGYRVLGETPLTIIYFTTMSYNPDQPDEKEFRGMMTPSDLTGRRLTDSAQDEDSGCLRFCVFIDFDMSGASE